MQTSHPLLAVVHQALGRMSESFDTRAVVAGVELVARRSRGSDIAEDLADAGRMLRRAGLDATAVGCSLWVQLREDKPLRMPWEPEARVS